MPRIPRKNLPPAGIFHVTTRGAGQIFVYLDGHDHRYFDTQLHEAMHAFDLNLHAWCQMKTHYHVLVEGRREDVSRAMHPSTSVTRSVSTNDGTAPVMSGATGSLSG